MTITPRRLQWVAVGACVAAGVTVASLLWLGDNAGPDKSDTPIRFGLASHPSGSLAIFAVETGRLPNVVSTNYPSGARALAALLAGEVDVVSTSETPIVFAALERQDFRIVATIGSVTNGEQIIARRDAGILQAADLRGKRLATQRGSAVHFFLYLFLIKNGMQAKDVELSFLPAEELVAALSAGKIDAFCMREPYLSEAAQNLRDNTTLLAAPGIYFRTEHLVVRADFLQRNPLAIQRLLRGFLDAEREFHKDPRSAIGVVAGKLGIDPAKLFDHWQDYDLRIGLHQSLFRSMEDEAQWAIEAGLTGQREMPNFLRIVEPAPLLAVKPQTVTIIR